MAPPRTDKAMLDRAGFEVYAFSLMEYELGIIVACLPALQALKNYMTDDARPKDNEGKLLDDQTVGASPECENGSWYGGGAIPSYGGRNRVVVAGGYVPD